MINNTYPESVEESGNYLRIALQNISKHQLPYTPISYLLWYEYATGRNDSLIKDIELFLKKKEPVTFEIIMQLIRNHLVNSKAVLAEEKVKEFQKTLVEITQYLGKSAIEINLKSNTLEACAVDISQAVSLDTITVITQQIVLEAKSIAESSKKLKGKLDSAVLKIDVLSKELNEIKHTAKTDMLTSLLNRRGFSEAMVKAMETTKITREPFSIIMLDIDHFKKINDEYGHLIGDHILKMVSKLLTDYIKGKDIASRFGGEEFILILPQTSLEGAYILAEQIRLSLQKKTWTIKDTGKSIGQISVSLGIALYKIGESVDTVIKRADTALYHAKNTGRNKTITECNIEQTS